MLYPSDSINATNSTVFIFQKLLKNVHFTQEEPCRSGIEMERELIVERTSAGLEVARSKDRISGRRPKLTPEQWAQAGRLIGAGVPRQQVAIIYDVGLSKLYRKFPASKLS
ncbi:helix-turn-helix domain-containing protein, partial [Salmonella enterica]|nr:helix-turn-helix domain-containing protein [Salmonella enterica]